MMKGQFSIAKNFIMGLEIKKQRHPDSAFITAKIIGGLDGCGCQKLYIEMMALLDTERCVILNFAEVNYLSTHGVGRIVNIFQTYEEKAIDLFLVCIPEQFFTLFEMLGLCGCLPIYENEQEAIAAYEKKQKSQ